MSLTAILAEVQTIVAAVELIGPVLLYSRFTDTEKSLKDTYVAADNILRPWIITREGTESKDMGPGWSRDRHRIVLHGFRAVQSGEDSEQKMQDEAEAVRAALRDETARLLSGVGRLVTPCSCRVFDARMFAQQVLCWHAELIVSAEEKLAP